MKENKLVELSMNFAVDIINLVKHLKANHETIISGKLYNKNGQNEELMIIPPHAHVAKR